ncbi:hypothetical protein CARUB_v10027762mg [Capsella rubella]|uniref:Purple acid phosphatase n=1 Tax=Capsella rubella TaxID=81985 RepID=R0GQC3_9BRAS|nr:hypothetical protein CARUB_v10027762mg [Capsella rubella]
MVRDLLALLCFIVQVASSLCSSHESGRGDQALSQIDIYSINFALHHSASIHVSPRVLGSQGEDTEWVNVDISNPEPSSDDWVGVFSPAKFDSSSCAPTDGKEIAPFICSAPIKYMYAKSSPDYMKTGSAVLKFMLINQRADFSFALFTGGLSNPTLVAVSNHVSFINPKAPVYPRLALGKNWDEMSVTWTSGYNIDEAVPFVEWSRKGAQSRRSPAGTLTFTRNSMCDLCFRNTKIKGERDGSNEYNNYQPGSLNTTDQLIKGLKNIDIVFHIGDIAYANGYISQWDQFTAQVEPIASTVPYMIASGNHERDWPDSGSFYSGKDSGGECGVPAETMFDFPAENKAKFWYSADYGMFRFCVADTEHDWREGSEQYRFIERCLASVDRKTQPWLIFIAHRVLGYSTNDWYGQEGSFEEPMGRESLQKLWQKYKVDIAFYGHVHNYERTCPIYQSQCVDNEKSHYSGTFKGTIHVVVGGAGSHLSSFSSLTPNWSIFRDYDYGFVKLTAFNHSSLLFEYKKSSNGAVHDSFTIDREYRDILACVRDSCEPTTLAS